MLLAEDPAVQRARLFKALADPTRVRIFDFLRQRCGPVAVEEGGEVRPVLGPTFGEVCCHVTGKARVDTSTSFHLRTMEKAGLISVEKRGRFMVCSVNGEAVAALAGYLVAPEPLPCGDADGEGCC